MLILLAGGLWGIIGLFVRRLGALGFSTMQMVAARAVVAALVLLVIALIRDRRLLRVRLRDMWMFAGTGIVSFVFFNWCYFSCMQRCSLSVAAVLLYTAPMFVMLLSAALFGERLTRRKLAALGLALAGCALVSGIGGAVSPAGLLAGLGAGIGYALYTIFGTLALRRYSSLTVTFYTFLAASVGVLPFIRLGDTLALIESTGAAPTLILLGVLTNALPYLLYTKGLTWAEPGRAAVLATVEPVVAAVVSVAVVGEPLGLPALLGMALVLAAILVVNQKEKEGLYGQG